jgi:MFS family permease
VLTATVLGSAMAQLDATVVGIAQPAIGKDFHATIAGLQWVSAGYLLTVAGLILLAGALCDRFGRRLIFVIGVAWFAVASLICAIAPNIGLLIAARMLQGVGGALLTPGSLAILQASFAPEERGRVIGAWSGLGGVATALGPFVGGFLITAISWRLIFLINAPIAVAILSVCVRSQTARAWSTAPSGVSAT